MSDQSPPTPATQGRQRPRTQAHRADLFREATAIVEAEYGHDLSLDAVARRVACSRRQLQRAYREAGGTSFRGHLTVVRMERAADLLRHGVLPVREVARRVGYRQPAQFAKAFRRCHGVTPSELRSPTEVLSSHPGAHQPPAMAFPADRRAA
jgi:transcriptional regulator GlxA family with amidase domain